MTSRLQELALRREALVARADAGRARLASIAADLRGDIALAETAFDVVRQVNRHRVLLGSVAAAVVVFGPGFARRWISRLLWLAPLALQAYRLARAIKPSRDFEQA